MRVAAVDIGTNTARLLVAEVEPGALLPPSIRWLDRRSTVTRLGAGVDASGLLDAAAIQRTVDTLSVYGDAIANWNCEAIRAVATSATRDAANRDLFLDRAELAIGARPDVVGGEEEARLAFGGTTRGVEGPGPFLVIDPGGGSTEFVLGTTAPDYAKSVDIGSVRLSERLFPDRPASPDQVAAARAHVDELLGAQITLPVHPAVVLGVGGTYTSLAAIHLGLAAYDSDAVHGTVVDRVALHEMTDRIAGLTIAETEAIPSLDPARAPVLLGGAVVAERALFHVGAATIVTSEQDILDGIALSAAGV